jgi:hypothetical protein
MRAMSQHISRTDPQTASVKSSKATAHLTVSHSQPTQTRMGRGIRKACQRVK